MRAMVLIVLGGSVLFLFWRGFGPVRAGSEAEPGGGDAPESARPAGRMLSVAELEAAIALEDPQETDALGEVSLASLPPELDPAHGGSAEAGAAGSPFAEFEARQQEPPPLEWNLGDPVAEGSLLLHDVERLPDYLKGPGSDLSEGRKSLLFGYGLLIRGLLEHAGRHRTTIEGAPDVTAAERDLFLSALQGGRVRPLPASTGRASPLLLGVRMALLEREADEMLRSQRFREAAETLSSLLLAELDAPWPSETGTLQRWSANLASAQARHRWDRTGEWPSIEVEVQRGDNLVAIRKRVLAIRPDLNVCTGLIARANQIGRYLQPGPLRIPTAPVSVLVDLSARWACYLHGNEVVASWPVAIGRDGKTIPGRYAVGEKLEDPPWFQAGREPVPFGDPENPLGTRWIAWESSDGLGFHGTWEPESLGTATSEGCVRMRNADVEELFEILPRGAPIEIRP